MSMTKNEKSKESIIKMLIPQKKDSKQKKIQKISLITACVGLIICIVILTIALCTKDNAKDVVANQSEQQSSSDEVSSETSSLVSSEVSSEAVSSEVSSKEVSSKTSSTAKINNGTAKPQQNKPAPVPKQMPADYLPKFSNWYSNNSDIKGHLVIPNTKVNYPVVQGKNNTYYLNRNVYRARDCWGVPYVDYRVVIGKGGNSKNIMIYGHGDDRRGLMLSNMKGYRDVNFYKSHPVIQFDTVYEASQWKVITMFKENTNPNRGNKVFEFWNCLNLSTDNEFNNYISAVKQRAFFTSTVDVNPSDQLLSIQVCENTNRNNYNRLVLVCRKVRAGEDASVDTSGAVQAK